MKRELDSAKENVKKDAVKKVIAAMTVGKDVSPLFPDVVKCIRTSNLELKKLVYLYIMNYAKTQPETAILSVNAFVHVKFCPFLFSFYSHFRFANLTPQKDAQHANPLVRALAVRTMGCIRVDKITEYLCQPLRECLKVHLFSLASYSIFLFVGLGPVRSQDGRNLRRQGLGYQFGAR